MAEISPFTGWIYNINNQTEDPDYVYNQTHIQNTSRRELFNFYKKHNIVKPSTAPSIYVCLQTFYDRESCSTFTRKSFICLVKLPQHPQEDILMHENVIDIYVREKLEALLTSKLEENPALVLYQDETGTTEKLLEKVAKRKPVIEFNDSENITTKIFSCSEKETIQSLKDHIKEQDIILADGHHRFSAALQAKEKLKNTEYQEASEYQLMMLSNINAPELVIKPIHRGISGLKQFDIEDVIEKIKDFFYIKYFSNPDILYGEIKNKKNVFGLLFPDVCISAELKDGLGEKLPWNFPQEVKNLSYTILHYYIIEKGFGIEGKHQKNSKKINYITIFDECKKLIQTKDLQAVILTNSVTITDIINVCKSGYTLPQKSTNFFPKAINKKIFREWE